MEILLLLLESIPHFGKDCGAGSPLLQKLFNNVLGREVEVDLGRQQRVIA